MTTSDSMLAFVHQLTDAWNSHDVECLLTLYDPDYEGTDVAQAAPYRGLEGARESLNRYLQAFPDIHFTTEDVLVAGDSVSFVWKAEGTHRGILMNIPATSKKIAVRGVSILTICEGKIKRGLYIWDVAGMLRELGLLPDLH